MDLLLSGQPRLAPGVRAAVHVDDALRAVLTIFVANPLSGLATDWWWLPQPWGLIGHYMPIGSAGYLLRSISFFDNHHGGNAWTVLVVWMLTGALLIAVGEARNRRAVTA